MSFILDALKKSEAERQRQAGPTLLEVRITQPRRRYPSWLIVVTALLLANVAVLLAFLLRHPSAQAPVPAAPAALATVPSVPVATPASPASPAANLSANTAVPTSMPAGAAATAPPVAAASVPASTVTPANSADDQPAIEAAAPGTSVAKSLHEGIDLATLPSFNEVAGSVPDLRLDLHVYDDQPSKRYALINMHRVREGDLLPEGARVLAITAAGVALDYRGQQFMLHPQ